MTVSSLSRRLSCVAPLLASGALLLGAGSASAAYFPSQVIDGPTPDLGSSFDVDIARDGTGALAYVKSEGGVDHVYVSRLLAGVWSPGERVEGALDAPETQPSVAAGPDGRIVVTFVADGTLFGVLHTAEALTWGPPVPLATGAADPSVDMSLYGTAYVSFTIGTDVRAARLDRKTNTWTVFDTPLDADPAQAAGDGPDKRARLSVSASGTALVAWGETGADGRTHVMARRVLPSGPSSVVNDLTLATLDGRAAGDATTPDVDTEDDDSYAWVVFRQAVGDDGGTRQRAVARRLRGSRFEDPVTIDGLSSPADENATAPRVAMTGRGEGVATSGRSGTLQAVASVLHGNLFTAPLSLSGGNTGGVIPAAADDGLFYGVWWQGDGTVHARQWVTAENDKTIAPPGSDTVLTDASLGAVDGNAGLDASTDRYGDMVTAFVQSSGEGRRLVVAGFDRPPADFRGYTTTNWRPLSRPALAWAEAQDLWGVTYHVTLDGQPVGTTAALTFTPPTPLTDGTHTWTVTAVDTHGQAVAAAARLVRVDSEAPTLAAAFSRSPKAGRATTINLRVTDGAPAVPPVSSGLRPTAIHWGDRTPDSIVKGSSATHRYAKKGRYTVVVTASDVAGNATAMRKSLTVKR